MSISITPGTRFGRLIVLKQDEERTKKWRIKFVCLCDCGKIKSIVSFSLRKNITKSCGCLSSDVTSSRSFIHGQAKRKNETIEFRIWTGIKNRCFNKNEPAYPRYGGRGITICERWLVFQNFFDDMGKRPSKNHSVERRENDGIYEPSNCYWGTRDEQARNKRNNRWIEYAGKRMILTDWAKYFGVGQSVLGGHLRKKTFEETYNYYKQKGVINV